MRPTAGFSRRRVSLGLAAAVWLGTALPVSAQFLGNVGGISIDPKGVLHETKSLPQDERLKLIQQEAVGGPASQELAASAPLRFVSLKRWEQRVAQFHQAGESLPADVEHLAGLTQIQYVIFDPEKQDVILAGPAEGWKQLPSGEVVGTKSHRPVLHADDLIAALRYAFAETRTSFIGCSIDPTPEGIQRYAAYLKRLGRIDRSRVKPIFAGMEQAMGPQAVRLFGVEPTSRFALAMLAADYRLKRIALGHDASPVKDVSNYLELTAKNFKPGPQNQHHWWFQARFDAIRETPDHLAFELVGQGLEVVTSSTLAGADQAASPNAEEFAESFTKHFTEIAGKQPIFSELQNLIGLAVASELIAEKQRQGEAADHWKPEHLLNAEACPLRKYHVPKQVPSIANYRLIRNRHWLISISGGVEISPDDMIREEKRDVKLHPELTELREQIRPNDESKSWWSDQPRRNE